MRFETRDVVVRYRPSRPPALAGVSMSVPDGSLCAILGPNGSGKSTLMRALLGSVPCERGEVRIDDRPLATWNRRELARAVGAVPQSEGLAFPVSVRELVAMGRYPHLGPLQPERSADRSAIHRALERCHALELADREAATLSGGELQRVRLARALAQEPRALVLDEPTASLDLRHEMEILQLLRASADEGLTVVLITHHLEAAARFADHLLLLDRGRVAAEGTAEAVLREDVLERVYGWPVAIAPDPASGTLRVTPLLRR